MKKFILIVLFISSCNLTQPLDQCENGEWQYRLSDPYSLILFHTKTGEIKQTDVIGTKKYIDEFQRKAAARQKKLDKEKLY